jgi:hypothetical protein
MPYNMLSVHVSLIAFMLGEEAARCKVRMVKRQRRAISNVNDILAVLRTIILE